MTDYHVSCNKPFSLVIIDVDQFKGINDKYGHVAGDEILMQVAAYIKDKLYPDDMLFRLGGDEFAVISRCIDYKTLQNYIADICVEASQLTWNSIDPSFTCTLSIGAAVYRGETIEQLINRADEQLYISKANGRNRANVA
ncbi:GGDEF family protein [Vibrio maritimus]|uniref:diguanylate cyclase n=1 Tax=Vibrio maritimus TaxID=990268 RepID=A0A090RY71_9VIBR|nr:GGDEF family protein [Vibrio maritimus]